MLSNFADACTMSHPVPVVCIHSRIRALEFRFQREFGHDRVVQHADRERIFVTGLVYKPGVNDIRCIVVLIAHHCKYIVELRIWQEDSPYPVCLLGIRFSEVRVPEFKYIPLHACRDHHNNRIHILWTPDPVYGAIAVDTNLIRCNITPSFDSDLGGGSFSASESNWSGRAKRLSEKGRSVSRTSSVHLEQVSVSRMITPDIAIASARLILTSRFVCITVKFMLEVLHSSYRRMCSRQSSTIKAKPTMCWIRRPSLMSGRHHVYPSTQCDTSSIGNV